MAGLYFHSLDFHPALMIQWFCSGFNGMHVPLVFVIVLKLSISVLVFVPAVSFLGTGGSLLKISNQQVVSSSLGLSSFNS